MAENSAKVKNTNPKVGKCDIFTTDFESETKYNMEEASDGNSSDLKDAINEEAGTCSPDCGYGLVLVVASFLTHVIVDGVGYSIGIFLIDLEEYYGGSKAKLSWVGSVLNGMYLSVGPIVGELASCFGCRTTAITGSILAATSYILSTFSPNVDVLILTYGVMGGFGFGLMYLPAIVMVGLYFDRKRALATGIAVSGSGIGTFVFAPLCRYLIDTYGWKGATWILAGICLQGVFINALYRPIVSTDHQNSNKTDRVGNNKPKDDDESESNFKQEHTDQNVAEMKPEETNVAEIQKVNGIAMALSDNQESGKSNYSSIIGTLQLLKNPVFLIYGISCFISMTGYFVPLIFLPDHADRMGLSKQQGAFLISIIGIANTMMRVVCGLVSDRSWVDSLLLNNVALIIAGVAVILYPYCFNYALLATASAVFGSGIAVYVSLRSIIVVDLLGLDNLTGAFGLVTMFQGLATFIGAPIAGALFDATRNYHYSFYLAGSALALSGMINLPLRKLASYLHKRREASLKMETLVEETKM